MAWPRRDPESRASSCPFPSPPGKRRGAVKAAQQAAGVAELTERTFAPQVGVHARARPRDPRGRDAGGVTKPKGVAVSAVLTGLRVNMDGTSERITH